MESIESCKSVEVFNLLASWEMSFDAIKTVIDCRINTLSRLKMMSMEDINELFNSRNLFGEKVCFRYHLQKWRTENKYEPLQGTVCTSSYSSRIHECICSPIATDFTFKLKETLEKTVDGKDIISKFLVTNTLNEKDQTSIVRIIVDHFILNNVKMDAKTMESLAKDITKLFPTENTTAYYIPRSKNKNACGKLYDRYYNQRNKRKNIASRPTSPKIQKLTDEFNDGGEEMGSPIDVAEFHSKKKWLVHNFPQDIKAQWKLTSVLRLKEKKTCLKEFLNDWPRYKDPNGYELIDIDFETLNPGKQNLMFEKIADLEKVMIENIFPTFIKDKLNMQYYQKLKVTTNINARNLYLFYLLHAVIVPPRLTKNSKPSISDGQTDMIVHIVNINNLVRKKEELKELALQEKSTLQPKIFIIGENWNNLTEIFVIFNDITYKVETLLRAVDLVIKICYTFDLEYSSKSKYVWVFLQEYIYKIPSLEKIAKVQNILSKIENVGKRIKYW